VNVWAREKENKFCADMLIRINALKGNDFIYLQHLNVLWSQRKNRITVKAFTSLLFNNMYLYTKIMISIHKASLNHVDVNQLITIEVNLLIEKIYDVCL